MKIFKRQWKEWKQRAEYACLLLMSGMFYLMLDDSLVSATVNQPSSSVSIGQKVQLGGQDFVKVNNNGLLMMTSTYACPHGKKIGGQYAYCYTCDNNQHGFYNYELDRCDCESGYNYRSSDTKCITCPTNSAWDSSGEVCSCEASYYMQGDNASCLACPANSSSAVGSTSLDACFCVANYYKNNDTCVSCPENSTSSAGSTAFSACKCRANYYMNGSTCASCPTNSTSTVGATSISGCQCAANYYMNSGSCVACPAHSSSSTAGGTSVNSCKCEANYYMNSGSCASCPEHSAAPAGSTSVDACVCGIGYESTGCARSGVYSTLLDTYYDDKNCSNPVAWMDQWTGCNDLTLVAKSGSVTNEELAAQTVCLLDPRDHRSYRVRKFTDDKCWTIDSLRFGGAYGETDGCKGAGNFSGGGSTTLARARQTFALGYYGHCLQNTVDYNYLYDWVAAMQSTLAYSDSSTTFSGVQQGLCPSGWHLPTGDDTSSELRKLISAYSYLATKSNLVLSGAVYNSTVQNQGQYGNYWSSSANGNGSAYSLGVNDRGNVYSNSESKNFGLAVRCVQD
ncbi:hypothetical protein IJJ27_00305 [bacterium]|nr:hypothetical protein [bacterium]MBQ6435991.1 hypothetical protein [bacterium]